VPASSACRSAIASSLAFLELILLNLHLSLRLQMLHLCSLDSWTATKLPESERMSATKSIATAAVGDTDSTFSSVGAIVVQVSSVVGVIVVVGGAIHGVGSTFGCASGLVAVGLQAKYRWMPEA
jgi:hypothetical protein